MAELGGLLEEEVSPETRAHLEAHLAACTSCEVLFDSTLKTIRIITESDSFELRIDDLKSSTQDIMAKIRRFKWVSR